MFEEVEELAARLLAAADPEQDDRFEPNLDLRAGGLVDELVELKRTIAAGQARTMVILAGLCRRAETWQDVHDPKLEAQVGPEDLVAAEIAPALRLSPVTASIQVRRAVQIATRLPATLAVFATGGLDLGRVLAIDEATSVLSDADAAKVEELLLPNAVDQTAGELRAALRRAVIAVDPAAAEKRRKQAVKDRSVDRYADKDGTSVLRMVLSAVDTGEIYDLIDQVARRTKTTEDTRSVDARRADAAVWLLLGRDPHLGPECTDDDPPSADPQSASKPDLPNAPAEPSDQDQPADPDHPADPDDLADPDDPDPTDAERPTDPDDLTDGADSGDAGQAGQFQPDGEDRGPDEPPDPEAAPPDPSQSLVNPGWRDRQLSRLERVSALAALALSAMTTRRPPARPWVAINQTTNQNGTVCFVGELQGYGPITATYAESLLTTGAAVAPPERSGREPTPAQARTHDPPVWLDREVRARDGTCRFPGCKQPAHRSDLDHVIPFPRGLTLRANLGGLCRRHHRVKGSGCWSVKQHDDGIYTWTSTATGRSYTTYPRGTTGDWRGATSH